MRRARSEVDMDRPGSPQELITTPPREGRNRAGLVEAADVRKQDPNDVIAAFQNELRTVQAAWHEIRSAIGRTTGSPAKRASTDAFTRAAVAFEAFRSDWHIAAINRDSQVFRATLTADAVTLVRAGPYPILASRLQIDLPLHPALDLIRELLAARGDHLSIRNYTQWKARAKAELTDPWKGKIDGMHNADRAVLNAVVALRNVLAHNSTRASETANEALSKFLARDTVLKRGKRKVRPSGVPSYLNAVTPDGRNRLEHYVTRLDALATSLIV